MSNGYKILRIIFNDDFLPTDYALLKIINKCLENDLLKTDYIIIDLANYK